MKIWHTLGDCLDTYSYGTLWVIVWTHKNMAHFGWTVKDGMWLLSGMGNWKQSHMVSIAHSWVYCLHQKRNAHKKFTLYIISPIISLTTGARWWQEYSRSVIHQWMVQPFVGNAVMKNVSILIAAGICTYTTANSDTSPSWLHHIGLVRMSCVLAGSLVDHMAVCSYLIWQSPWVAVSFVFCCWLASWSVGFLVVVVLFFIVQPLAPLPQQLSLHLCWPQRHCCHAACPSILSSDLIADSFHIWVLLPEVHRWRCQIVGGLPSKGDTALLPCHFGGVQYELCF